MNTASITNLDTHAAMAWPHLWLRDALYLLLLILASPWLLLRAWKTGRYREGRSQKLFGLRAAVNGSDCAPGKVIWLHGVSVGEVQLMAALQRNLAAKMPEARFVLSTTTQSGRELADRLLPDVERFYFPLDFSWAIHRTLSALQPSLIVLGELELWPNLIDIADRKQIPIIVVNGRLSDSSFRRYRRFRRWTHSMFSKITYVAAQTEPYAERFVQCGCPADRVSVTGNLKFDNVAFSTDDPHVAALRQLAGIEPQHRVVIVGSSQQAEENAVLEAFRRLRRQHPQLKLIIVPRHPERFDEVFQRLSSTGLRVARRSQLSGAKQDAAWDVLLVDTIGELKWWWGLAEVAIVGGSFGQRGGQNMLEPAAYGRNVAFGPNTSNFRDIAALLLETDAAVRLPSVDAIDGWLEKQLDAPEDGRRCGRNARGTVASQQGATQLTIDILLRYASSQSSHLRSKN